MSDDLVIVKSLLVKMLNEMTSVSAQQPKQPSQPQPKPIDIKGIGFGIGENPILGSESAKLIVVEFIDYQCSYCSEYTRVTFPEIKRQYIDKGLIRYVVIDQPLITMHPDASKAAEASHCAQDQGKFWEMHDAMMANQSNLKDLTSYARALNLNIVQFEECLNTEKHREAVSRDMSLANRLGITGVPGFIIGAVSEQAPGSVVGISIIRGAAPFESFHDEIESALKQR